MTELVQLEAAKTSGFDTHHPPEKELLEDCVHCGFCLPACPTYVLWGEEMDSPRGRIYMMNKISRGESPLNERFREHIDHCLGCMACMTACPSGVQYNKLIEDTRGQIERNLPRSAEDASFRKLLYAVFPHAGRLRLLALPLLVYQRTGLQRLVRASGLLKMLPRRMAAMESLLPAVPSKLFQRLPAKITPAKPRLRVGMLAGCVQQVFFQHVNQATARVLAAEGCEVIIPQQQECCGALMLHSGLEEDAAGLARRMIAAFEAASVDIIVINAAGCGSTMKEYGYLLRDDPAWASRAAAFSAKCRDISEILSELPPQSPRHPLPLRVAYHDACHLRHAQGVYEPPRALLAAIPQLQVAELEEANLCCGSAGIYNLLHPEPASQLGDRKVENLLAAKAEAVVSANPGCLLQLMSGLQRRGASAMPAFHMIELLDASIRNVSAESLLQQRH
ncbi:(Fe-S)-binding protein [Paracidobacterium acidisoli]|uniref:Glycolate oxidase iron-sulfur subunit n=1 Tax=Paracidobacterium acidisoli TaxID=2303751 RepID=A0A372IL44_9BACT|nr:heterodisulfide reductase-related iron-sulfur binding cluster [Paracidobacterium acidisoli]MBT9332203.1 4Fe-4S dicluster domain-containing protein [Paracidobacterium acidisoli]